MSGIDYSALRRQLRLERVLELLAFVPAARRGSQLRGPCPVHGSRTPQSRSFAAHLGWHGWHCFRCGAGGNALDLWVAVTRLPVYAAALDLCRRLHLDVPRLPAGRPRPSRSPPRR